jgi:hypothetical protein
MVIIEVSINRGKAVEHLLEALLLDFINMGSSKVDREVSTRIIVEQTLNIV